MLIVKTTGSFMLCPLDGQTPNLDSQKPTLVPASSFVKTRISLGQLEVLAEDVPNTLTQADVEDYLKPKAAAPVANSKGKVSKSAASKGD